MAASDGAHAPRYHRRVLALGVVVLLAAYVIGAPTFNNRIEADLERRVPAELADAGFDGITAEFDGQDGRLTCDDPLDDPEAAVGAAYDVWGVRQIDLDQGCRVRSAAGASTEGAAGATSTEGTTASTAGGDPGDTGDVAASTPAEGSVVDFATVSDIIAGSPELSLFSALLGSADPIHGEPGDVTVFAPSDAAFDQLPADVLADLRGDHDLLATVVGHHAVTGRLLVEDLVTGPLTTLTGDTIDIVREGDDVLVDGARVTDPDMVADDGVVHVINRILVPDGVDFAADDVADIGTATASASFQDGTVTFDGVVKTEVERTVLLAAVSESLGDAAIADGALDVDPEIGLDADTVADLAALVGVLTTQLVGGAVVFDGEGLVISGRYADDARRDAVLAVADSVGADTDLELRPAATESDADELETELNEYATANPILFEPGSAVLTPSAATVIDGIARRLEQFDGVEVTVEGHTDSDGSPDANLVLSQQRADAVVAALVDRGLAAPIFTAEGFGNQRPVLVDGAEDKAASRRVEFRVVSTS